MKYREFIPVYNKLYQKLEESISVVSSFNPLLGYQLYMSHGIGDIFTLTTSNVDKGEELDGIFLEYISELDDTTLPLLDESVLTLSKKHGLFTYFKVKSLLKEELEMPSNIIEAFEKLKRKLDNSDT